DGIRDDLVTGVQTCALPIFYMFRLIFLTFHGKPRYDEHKVHVHESPWSMRGPLVVLAILSVAGGWFALPAFFQGPDYFANFLGRSEERRVGAECSMFVGRCL